MRKAAIAGTDLVLSRLGFGTASLHHVMAARGRQDLLAAAADAGITHFDTARMYGEGMAERALGDFLARGRSGFTVATKVGFAANGLHERLPLLLYAARAAAAAARRFGMASTDRRRALSVRDADRSLTASLRAMRTDWVDILFVHEPRIAEVAAIAQLCDWLSLQKREGRARWLGLSGIAAECVAVAKALPGVFEVLQVEDSIDAKEADALAQAGRPLQLTYGYVRRATPDARRDATRILAEALQRNPRGTILVSSRQPARVRELARVAEDGA